MLELTEQNLKPVLSEPFPNVSRIWTCPKTGLKVPKFEVENITWRHDILKKAETDSILRKDLFSACRESLLFWVNTFVWTYHQHEVNPDTGERYVSKRPHVPFITWEWIQDDLFNEFEKCLADGEDILIDKSRDMGASWMCISFLHHLWLFEPDSQLLELSRTQDYVDKTGNMKALFQKHDYINNWLPSWMLPPDVLPNQQNRTKMHLMNVFNNSCIDGESTTENAASGDRRKAILLDEFSKVEHGAMMRSATRDVAPMRIVNSTPSTPGSEYSKWKNSGQIKVFVLPFYEHPTKGKGRYVVRNESGGYDIRSLWFDREEKIRSPQEMAREVLRDDQQAGAVFFTLSNVEKHKSLFGRPARERFSIHMNKSISDDSVSDVIKRRDLLKTTILKSPNGPLRVWTNLILGRPDQTKTYIIGIDIGKGQGASNSVMSIKCVETGEKIAEWADANVPPYEMTRVAAALALWVGGRKPRCLPFLRWENNGPGWDFGRIMVKTFKYPYYHRKFILGTTVDKKTQQYGWHNDRQAKFELLSEYDRQLAHGGYINHSIEALNEMKSYIHFDDGGIGPSSFVEENPNARKIHGDRVMADALSLDNKDTPKIVHKGAEPPEGSFAYRRQQKLKNKHTKTWKRSFDFSKTGSY